MDNYSTIIPNGKSSKSRDTRLRNDDIINHNIVITGDDVPTMGELYTNVVHQYAAQWEQLGLKLGLQHYDIDNISKDNAHNPDRSVTCCRTMLEKWLQIVPSPTWAKLDDAIASLTTAPLQSTGHQGTVY